MDQANIEVLERMPVVEPRRTESVFGLENFAELNRLHRFEDDEFPDMVCPEVILVTCKKTNHL